MDNFHNRVTELLQRLSCEVFETSVSFRVDFDQKYGNRLFLQPAYHAKCTKEEKWQEWYGRKWYLSEHMTDDEIIKTFFLAFETCVKHEILEGFKVDGKILFNPHTDFEELLKVSQKEVKRS